MSPPSGGAFSLTLRFNNPFTESDKLYFNNIIGRPVESLEEFDKLRSNSLFRDRMLLLFVVFGSSKPRIFPFLRASESAYTPLCGCGPSP